MSWSASGVFVNTLADLLNNTTALDLNTDASISVALFNDTITPDKTVSSANTAYAAGVWASGGVSDASGWPAAGRDLVNQGTASGVTTNVYKFDADDTVSANSNTTLSNVYGCLVYDNTITTPVADQGVCFNYFGGANSVTGGTFTVVWNSSGIFTITV